MRKIQLPRERGGYEDESNHLAQPSITVKIEICNSVNSQGKISSGVIFGTNFLKSFCLISFLNLIKS